MQGRRPQTQRGIDIAFLETYRWHQTSAISEFDRRGIRIQIGTDFRHYRDTVQFQNPERLIGLAFDPDVHNLNADNSYFVLGFDDTGCLVLTQAVRLLSTDRINLSDYFSENFLHFQPPGLYPDTQTSRYVPGPSAKRLEGIIAYHGEVWIKDDKRYRGTGLMRPTAKLAFTTGMCRFLPNAFVGINERIVAEKGLPTRQGYMHCELNAFHWRFKDTPDVIMGHMVHQSAEDVDFLLSLEEH